MTLNSMTGFARNEGAHESCSWIWEAKSVNAKGLDTRVRLPIGFESLELPVRDSVTKRFHRGNFSISLKVSWLVSNSRYQLNWEALERLIEMIPKVQKLAPELKPITMDGLFAAKGVIENVEYSLADEQQNALNMEILNGLDDLLVRLLTVRSREGKELKSLLSAQLEIIEKLCREASELASIQPERIKTQLRDRVWELGEINPSLTEERLAQEVVMLALKADVREELDRLIVHINAARKLLNSTGAIGRQFDFLCQEFNREANTLCAKSADVELTQLGLTLKTVIDQIREQVQNIE